MARKRAPESPRGLAKADSALVAALTEAVRPLRKALRRSKVHDIDLERAIFARFGECATAHAGVRLKRPIREIDLFTKTHTLGVVVTTHHLVERVTEAVLAPGAYIVQLRPVGGLDFAFDLLDAKGQRVIAVPAHGGPSQKPSGGGIKIDIIVLDIEINDPVVVVLNPFKYLICLSFLGWKVCFGHPHPQP